MSLGMSSWLQAAKRAAGGTVARSARHASANSSHLLRWLVSLGGLGLFAVAIVDSSVIPLPLPGSTDLLLLLLTAHRGATAVSVAWLAFCAFAGSMVGGYLTWSAGRKGGEVALERYVPKRFLGRVKGWVERFGAWTIGISAILPPPVPLTPFLLAAGALGVKRERFLIFYGVARAIRYGLLAWLGLIYGRHIVAVWRKELDGWSTTILWTYAGLVVLGIGYGVWKFRRARKPASRAQIPAEDVA
jgi:membrane protein YqaA with SNARE-associated domain